MAKEIGYRTETFFGEGYRNAASVMAHKTFVLDNTDILSYLIDSDLIDQGTKDYLQVYVTLMEEGRLIYTGYATDYEEMLYRYRKMKKTVSNFFRRFWTILRAEKVLMSTMSYGSATARKMHSIRTISNSTISNRISVWQMLSLTDI